MSANMKTPTFRNADDDVIKNFVTMGIVKQGPMESQYGNNRISQTI